MVLPVSLSGQTHTPEDRGAEGEEPGHDRLRAERFRLLFDHTPDGITLLDPYDRHVSWPIVECNRAFCEMNGYTYAELIGQSIDIVHPEPDAAEKRVAYFERLRKSGTIHIEAEHRRKDGTVLIIETTTSFIELNGQEYIIGVDRDVTENKQAEKAARRRIRDLELLRGASLALTENLDLPSVLDVLLSAVMDLSPEARYTHIFLLDRGDLKFGAAANREGPLDQPISTPRPDGLTATVARQGSPIIVEDMISHPLFASRGWRGAIIGLPLKVHERVLGVMTVTFSEVHTVAEDELHVLHLLADHAALAIQNTALYGDLEFVNRHLEQAVVSATSETRQTLEHLQAIFQHSPNAILMVGPDATMRTANPAFLDLFHTTLDEITGVNPIQFVDPAYSQPIHSAAQQVRETRQPVQFEIAYQVEDGNWRDIAVALAPIEEDGNLLGMVCNLWDITAFKEIEQLKDAILAVAAHELRTPLTSVMGFSEILLTRDLDETTRRRYLTFISAQAVNLKQIIDDLLDASRLQAGTETQLVLHPVDVRQLVDKVAVPFNEQYPNHEIAIGGIPSDLIPGDAVRLEQVFNNLLTNAIKYSPDGGLIDISGQVRDGFVRLAFRDQGIGMTPDQQKHIFESFYRADTSNSAPPGVGLGLSICQRIVAGHGGSIAVESIPGSGSTFTVSLPLLPAA